MTGRFEKFLQSRPDRIDLVSYVSWVLVLVATLTSLFFSEGLGLPPCVLCWYQRIFMYPLVFVIPLGLLSKDHGLFKYVTLLSLAGGLIALYHTFIYYGIISETLKICNAELSCKSKQFELFNFLGIPALSLIAFTIIFFLNLQGARYVKRS